MTDSFDRPRIAAAAGGQWEKAEEHYRTALKQAHDSVQDQNGRGPALVRTMLIGRNAFSDKKRLAPC
jgi:hypothetical protein